MNISSAQTFTTPLVQYTASPADETETVNLSSLGAPVGSIVQLNNLSAIGDFSAGNTAKVFSLSINGGAEIPNLTTDLPCAILSALTTPINQFVSLIDIGSGVPGITLRVVYPGDVNAICSTYAMQYTADVTVVDTDGDGVADHSDLDDDNDGILDTIECGEFSAGAPITLYINQASQTVTLPAGEKSLVFDIYSLDNNFSLTINGVDIAGEMEFYFNGPLVHNEISFAGGIMYGEAGIPNVWTLGDGGITNRVDIRLTISASGVVSIFGIKSSFSTATLEEMFFEVAPSIVSWNTNTTNEIVIDQIINGGTNLKGLINYGNPCNVDTYDDGDGVRNQLDLDSDNDGIPDVIEAGGTDADKNGMADGAVGNTDSTRGIPSSAIGGLGLRNSDTDALSDFIDIDSDNDGIPDNIEAQTSSAYISPSGKGLSMIDVNNNGLDDAYEVGGFMGINPINTDGTGSPDYFDVDSDDDLIIDVTENGDADNLVSGTDTDGDGLDDSFDDNNDSGLGYTVNDGLGINDKITNVTNLETAYGDQDNDFPGSGDIDYRDLKDIDNDGVTDITDLDDDNDGILDSVECSLAVVPVTTAVSIVSGNAATISAPAGKTSLVFDIYKLDNSFSITVNGLNIDGEIEFSGTNNNPVTFTDGRRYGTNGIPDNIPSVWTLGGTATRVDVRLTISTAGIIKIFGVRSTLEGAVLQELNFDFAPKTVIWNLGTANTITIDQGTNGPTYLEGIVTYNNDPCAVDTDGNGILNKFDIDSDNDGIPDNVEAQTTADYNPPNDADTFLDYFINNGVNSAYLSGLTPVNTDLTEESDYLDADSDNDSILDIQENGGASTIIGTDADGDGLDDNFDTVNTLGTLFDVNDYITDPSSDLPDANGNVNNGGDVDYRDIIDVVKRNMRHGKRFHNNEQQPMQFGYPYN